MALNIDSCKNAINTIKLNINKCFTACDEKNSSYNETAKTTSELIKKINGINTGSSTPSVNMNAQACTHLTVTWGASYEDSEGNLIYPDEFTVDFGSIGVTFRSLIIYSATRDGYFSVNKLDSNKCIISAHAFCEYNDESIYGVTDLGEGTYRADYSINGNSIKFTRNDYPNNGVNYVGSRSDNFRILPMQIAPNPNTGIVQLDYLLELITVIV